MRLTAEVPADRFPCGLPRPSELIVMVLAGKQTIPVLVLAAERTTPGTSDSRRVATKDIDTYEQFVTHTLSRAPGVAKIDSHLTMKKIK